MLGDCLRALQRLEHEPGELEIVVVDDGSTDDTARVVNDAARSARVPTRLVRNPGRGVNAARNAGVESTSGPWVAFVDDDELVPSGWARNVLDLVTRLPHVDGIGGPVVEQPGTKLRTCSRCSLGNAWVEPGTDGRYDRLIGGNMVLRRELFGVVGPFDPTISGRGDEAEWFERDAARRLDLHYSAHLGVAHRRDQMTWASLWRDSFRQGRSLPAYHARTGRRPRIAPLAVPRYVAHAVRRRCANGVRLAARECGALTSIGAARLRWAFDRLRRSGRAHEEAR
jgi:glycosyltransferase involved in cell wall biosynthesis